MANTVCYLTSLLITIVALLTQRHNLLAQYTLGYVYSKPCPTNISDTRKLHMRTKI